MDRGKVHKVKQKTIVYDKNLKTSDFDKNKGNSKSESDTDVFSLYSPKVGFATQLKKYRNVKSKFIGASKITLLPKHTEEENGDKFSVDLGTFSVDEIAVGQTNQEGIVLEDCERKRIVRRKLFPDEEPNLREAVRNKLKLKSKKLRLKTKINEKTSSSFSRDFLNLPSRTKSPSFQRDNQEKIRKNSPQSYTWKQNYPSIKSSYRAKGSSSFQPKSASTPLPKDKNHCHFDFDCAINSRNNEIERISNDSRYESERIIDWRSKESERIIESRRYESERFIESGRYESERTNYNRGNEGDRNFFEDLDTFDNEFTLNKREFMYNRDDFWNCQEDVELDRSFQLIDAF